MERRVLLAISLSFLVLFLYQTLLVPPTPGTSDQVASPPPASPLLPASAPPASTPASDRLPEGPSASIPAATVVGDSEERLVTIESELVRATFTNKGGRLTSWELKQYRSAAGAPIDLVPRAVAGSPARPFSLKVDDEALTSSLNEALYQISGVEGTTVQVAGNSATLSFDVELADGLRATKRFTIEPSSYVVTFQATVSKGEEILNPTIVWGPGLVDEIAQSPAGSFLSPNYLYPAQAIFLKDGSVERIADTTLGPHAVYEGEFGYAGIDDHYFIAATVTPGPIRLEYSATAGNASAAPVSGRYVAWSLRGQTPPENVRFFVGPKQFDVLQSISPDFTKVIYFGMFAPLAVPLLGALQWVNGFVGNYGWSIVILTILINLAMWPLRHKSVVSMRRMQEVQPQLKAIQERYAAYKITDPERQKMNQEVMELYRSKGVNPASGCVPMLLTMPFLFAFYAMLSQAIEIRGADFLGWITDLSTHDPLYITPILMGATMFWQQRLTPTTADPMQQRVMMVMPLMFLFMFLWAPSGLVIYWLVSNLWAIGQQYFTNYLIGPPKVHNARPPAEQNAERGREGRARKPGAGAKA